MAWGDVVGQELPKRVLQAHLASGQVPGAYLLAGPEGIGKRKLALEMAKALNCAAESNRPCDQCPTCRQISNLAHPDLHLLVPSGASKQIKIEDVRQMIGRVQMRPFNARYQVVLMDGAEGLTEEAANSVLKVLEEPPAHTRFLLVTAQLSGCLPTIVSRCEVLHCQPLATDSIRQILTSAQGIEAALAARIAFAAGGSASRALELAGRWASYETVMTRLASGSSTAWLTQPMGETREDVGQLLDGMIAWLRDVSVMAATGRAPSMQATHADALARQSRGVDLDRCLETALGLIELRQTLEQFASARLVASIARERWLSLNHLIT